MKWLKLKIPPPFWFLVCAALMWLMAGYFPASLSSDQNRFILSLMCMVIVAAAVVATLAIKTIHQAKTTHSPFQPEKTSQLVTWGIYSKSRNPMYLSLLFGLIAWALWLNSLVAWLGVPLFVWLITYFQIQPEEQILTTKFGQPYLDYIAKVRRWL